MRNEEQYRRGQHPNSKKNLQMFKEGDVPNPNGKPKGAIDVKNRLIKMLENISPGSVQTTKEIADFCSGVSNITNIDAVNARLLYCAIVLGEAWAVKEVFDRVAGKAAQSLDLDVQVSNNWQEEAKRYGLSTHDIIEQLRPLIAESALESSDASGD